MSCRVPSCSQQCPPHVSAGDSSHLPAQEGKFQSDTFSQKTVLAFSVEIKQSEQADYCVWVVCSPYVRSEDNSYNYFSSVGLGIETWLAEQAHLGPAGYLAGLETLLSI